MKSKLETFTRERDKALLSLDEYKIRAMFFKFNEREMPANKEVFWAAVHKAITGNLNLPINFRNKSKVYLTDRGLQSLDDGDL